jgi:hypothetical protein
MMAKRAPTWEASFSSLPMLRVVLYERRAWMRARRRSATRRADDGVERLLAGDDQRLRPGGGGRAADALEQLGPLRQQGAVLQHEREHRIAHGEADGGCGRAAHELDEAVVAPAAGDSPLAADDHLEDHAGVVGQAADDGEIELAPAGSAGEGELACHRGEGCVEEGGGGWLCALLERRQGGVGLVLAGFQRGGEAGGVEVDGAGPRGELLRRQAVAAVEQAQGGFDVLVDDTEFAHASGSPASGR